MKKIFYLSIVTSILFTSSTFAYDEQMQDGFRDATKRNGRIAAAQKLQVAINVRHRNYLREKLRDNHEKNIKNQLIRHTLNRAEAGADGVSTFVERDGEMTHYDGRRPSTGSRVNAPNNAKRNFRTRAYNYYIDGGNAGTSVLESSVILSSEMTSIRRKYQVNNSNNVADIMSAVRQGQKNSIAPTAESTSSRRTTKVGGASSRNFIHPYMNIDLGN